MLRKKPWQIKLSISLILLCCSIVLGICFSKRANLDDVETIESSHVTIQEKTGRRSNVEHGSSDEKNIPEVEHPSIHATNPVPDTKLELVPDTMSLEEKIGQMVIAGLDGTSLQLIDETLITNYHVGGVIFYANNLVSPEQTRKFVNLLKEKNKDYGIPLFISVDQEGGRVSRLPGINVTPSNKIIGQKNEAHYAYTIGQTLGKQLKSMGVNLNYAPVLDINSNPNNPVIGDRSFGSNPSVVSKLGIQTMKGIQSEHVISVIKHFPGHGDTSVDSHVQLPVVRKSLEELNNLELIPFRKAIQEGADAVMVAHILLPKLDPTFPASMSKKVITDILRGRLHFNGVVMTDDLTMGAIVNHYGIGEAAVESILAGSDIVLVAHDHRNVVKVINAIKQAVTEGKITKKRINQSINRILKLKQRQ